MQETANTSQKTGESEEKRKPKENGSQKLSTIEQNSFEQYEDFDIQDEMLDDIGGPSLDAV